MTERPITTFRLISAFLLAERWRIAGAILAETLTIGASVGLMGVSAYLIERASQRPPILSLEIAIVSVRFFGISRGLFRYLERMLSHDAGFRVLGDLRADIYRRLIRLTPAGLGETTSGEVLSRIAADVDTVQEWFVRGFAPLCTSVITAMLVVVTASLILPTAGVALLLALPATGVLLVLLTRNGARVSRRELDLRGAETAAIVDYIQGIADLTALGAAGRFAGAIDQQECERQALGAARTNRLGLSAGIQSALPGIFGALLSAVGIAGLAVGLNPLSVGVLCFGSMAATECVLAISNSLDAWQRGLAATGRLSSLLSLPDPVPFIGKAELPVEHGRLSVSSIAYRYEVGPPVLEDISIEVGAGERVIISGRSGAGKSTLASLLLRFATPSSGSIVVSGIEFNSLSDEAVRSGIGALTQDAHLFAGSIRGNIMLAKPDASDAELREVLGRVHLEEWIDSLPLGWSTEVGELGGEVSGGQRRRIALVLLAGFRFLIADEPTEGLDTPTAQAIMGTLFDGVGDTSLIVITHRVDLCPPADAYFEMTDGRLFPVERYVSKPVAI